MPRKSHTKALKEETQFGEKNGYRLGLNWLQQVGPSRHRRSWLKKTINHDRTVRNGFAGEADQ